MDYRTGLNRLIYKSPQFTPGMVITAYMYSPSLVKTGPHPLTELDEEDGFYYFDFNFNEEGAWIGIFYENGVKKLSNVFRVDSFDSEGIVRYIK